MTVCLNDLPMAFPLSLLQQRFVRFRTQKYSVVSLAGVAQWIEHGPARQRAMGLIPSQDTCLGCRPGPE